MAYVVMSADGERFELSTGGRWQPHGLAAFKIWHTETGEPRRELIGTYADFFADLQGIGVNYIRLRLNNASNIVNAQERGLGHLGPLDGYDVQDVVTADRDDLLFPGDADFAARIAASTLTEIITHAETYGIGILIEFWAQPCLRKEHRWQHFGFKRLGKYCWDDAAFAVGDRGPLDDPLDFFVSAAALEVDHSGVANPWTERGVTRGDALGDADAEYITAWYQKRFVDFVYDNWGSSEAIVGWNTFSELMWMEAMVANEDRPELAARVAEWSIAMKAYVQSVDPHNRPVNFSDIRIRSSDQIYLLEEDETTVTITDWDGSQSTKTFDACSDYEKWLARYNYMYHFSDYIDYHNYTYFSIADRISLERMIRVAFPDKMVIDGEFWGEYSPDDVYEYPPWWDAKQYQWIHFIGQDCRANANRMSGRSREDDSSDPEDYYPTDLDEEWYYTCFEMLGTFITAKSDLLDRIVSRWAFIDTWEDHISSDDLTNVIATGQGKDVIAFIQGSVNSVDLTVENLEAGTYDYTLFDYLTGNVIDTDAIAAVAGEVDLTIDVTDGNLDDESDGYVRERICVFTLEAQQPEATVVTVVVVAVVVVME